VSHVYDAACSLVTQSSTAFGHFAYTYDVALWVLIYNNTRPDPVGSSFFFSENLRLDFALRLLLQANLSVGEIAHEVGL